MTSIDLAKEVFRVLFNLRQISKGDFVLSEVDLVLSSLNEELDEKITMEKMQSLLHDFPLKQKLLLGTGVEPFDYRQDSNNKFTHIGLIDRAYAFPEEWI